jgi:short-subunit dehydrogenase
MAVVLITGASSGIGEALAREYAARGADLVLLGRRIDRLEALKKTLAALGARVLTAGCDVTSNGDLRDCVESALRTFGRLDVVYANAGIGISGRFHQLTLDDYRRQFETNVFGVIRTALATVPALKESVGRLALLGSVAGHVAAPGMSPYAMSKFAVRAFANSIREELRPSGVSVTLISPGFVDSEIRRTDRAGVFQPDLPEPVPSWLRMPADKAARQIARAVDRRRDEVVITLHGKLMVFLERHAPRLMRSAARLLAPRLRKV